MFASLKNKIREEIGSDVTTVVKNAGSALNINSTKHLSEVNLQQQQQQAPSSVDEDEWRRRLQEKLDKRDKEWKAKLAEKEKERLKAEHAKHLLEIALRDAEEYKKTLVTDAKQLEGHQTQEMAKIKHLLLSKEQEVDEKSHLLKAALSEIDSLKTEVSRLRRYEEQLENIQDEMESLRHTTQREKSQLSGKLAQTQEQVVHLQAKVSVLEQRLALVSNESDDGDDRIANLMRERALLERKLEEAHLHLSDIKTSWSGTISSLETQVGRLSRQAGEEGLERRRVEEEKDKLKERIRQLEAEIEVNTVVMATKDAKLLRMAEDIDEMATELKELRASVDDEVEEFKRQIVESSQKMSTVEAKLAQVEQINLTLDTELVELRETCDAEKRENAILVENLEKEQSEKDSALLRNAQVSQNLEIAMQDQRRRNEENIELQNRVEELEKLLKAEKDNMQKDKRAADALLVLEDQLNEKTKTIKVLQQRLGDLKKTLQKELRGPVAGETAILSPSCLTTVTAKKSHAHEDDVNFKYLKHVLIKFLTSREYEALHLTRAVATLLHLTPEEERLLQDTLEWKMSWFGSRPNLGFGQTAKAIPPS